MNILVPGDKYHVIQWKNKLYFSEIMYLGLSYWFVFFKIIQIRSVKVLWGGLSLSISAA